MFAYFLLNVIVWKTGTVISSRDSVSRVRGGWHHFHKLLYGVGLVRLAGLSRAGPACRPGPASRSGTAVGPVRLQCPSLPVCPGGTTRAQWEDVTGSTPLTFLNDCVSFTTTVRGRGGGISTKFGPKMARKLVIILAISNQGKFRRINPRHGTSSSILINGMHGGTRSMQSRLC